MERDPVDYWDGQAGNFDQAADHGLSAPATRAAWRQLLSRALPPGPAKVADLGCGTGTLALLLAEMGYLVDGVDFSPAMLELARSKSSGYAAASFHLGDAATPPLPAGSYDVVLSRHVLWALPDPGQALQRWSALLKPAGRIVLVEGKWHTGAGLTANAVRDLLSAAGRSGTFTALPDPELWGGAITDERYIVVSLNRVQEPA